MRLFLLLLLTLSVIAKTEFPKAPPSPNDQALMNFFYGAISEKKDHRKALSTLEHIHNDSKFDSKEYEKMMMPQVIENILYLYWILEDLDGCEKYVLARKREWDEAYYSDNFLHAAKVHINRSDFKKARETLDQILKEDPTFKAPHFFYAFMDIKEKNFKSAYEHLEKLTHIDESNSQIPLLKGICLYRMGEFKKAEEELGTSLDRKNDAVTRFFYALVLNKLGDTETALRILKLAKWMYDHGQYDQSYLLKKYDKEFADDVLPDIEALDKEFHSKGLDTTAIEGEKPPNAQ